MQFRKGFTLLKELSWLVNKQKSYGSLKSWMLSTWPVLNLEENAFKDERNIM